VAKTACRCRIASRLWATVATSERGSFTGNRGIIHDARTRTLLQRRWISPAWLICTLHWRNVRRSVMGAGSWTELFFLDEATALAAGHRPCFPCRRPAARSFQIRFPMLGGAESPRHRQGATRRAPGWPRQALARSGVAGRAPARWRHDPPAWLAASGPERSGPSLVISRLWRPCGALGRCSAYHPAIHRSGTDEWLSATNTRQCFCRMGRCSPV
jgi:hypothetical protein